jgi:glycosyltransferase involved in cell wall biosynthesis
VAELVEDGVSGLLVPPGDDRALAAAILRALRDDGRMGAAGRAAVAAGFDSRTEAARLAILLVASVTGAPRPGKRPGEAP